MNNKAYRGTGVAVVTPFKNGEVDYASLSKIVQHLLSGAIDYIVALGSTGEAATLSDKESVEVLNHIIKVVDGKVPIVAGNFGSNDTAQLCNKIKGFDFTGIDAILSASPAYVKPTQEGIYQHYMAVEAVCPVPIILYNVPGRTASNMEWNTTIRLARASTKFIGIKEASGDISQAIKIIKNKPADFIVTSGDDETALAMVACGGDGVISVLANALPGIYSRMIAAGLSGDFDTARNLNMQTYDLHKWLYIDGNPVGIKAAMEVLGLGTHEVRLPLVPMAQPHYEQLREQVLMIKA